MSGAGIVWRIAAFACVAFIARPARAQIDFGPPAALNTNAAIDVADDARASGGAEVSIARSGDLGSTWTLRRR